MRAFQIDLLDQPGELQKVAQAIADKNINITAFSGSTCGDAGTVTIMTNDEAGTWQALIGLNHIVRDQEIVQVTLHDQAGQLANVAQVLANGGIDIEAAVPTGVTAEGISVGFVTAYPTTTRAVLDKANITNF